MMKKDVTLTEERCERCPESNPQFLYAVTYHWAKGDRIEMEDERTFLLGPLLEPRRLALKEHTLGAIKLCPYCDGPAASFAITRRT